MTDISIVINPAETISIGTAASYPPHASTHAPGAYDSLSAYYASSQDLTGFVNQNQTGYLTGIFYPYSANPAGYVQGAVVRPSNTGNFVDKSSAVLLTGDQNVSGTKNFYSRPTVNGTGVLLVGEGGAVSTGALTGAFYPLNANPSGYITGVDLSSYVTKSSTGIFVTTGQTGNFVTTSQTGQFVSTGSTGNFVTGSVVRPSETGVFITSSQTGQFVSTGSTGNFVTGSVVRPSETGIFITSTQTGAFLTTGAADGRYALQSATGSFITSSQTGQFVSTGSTGQFVTGSVVRPSETGALLTTGAADGRYALQSATGSFITASQTGQFVGTGSTGSFLTSSSTGAFLTTGAADNRYALQTATGNFVTTGQTGNFVTTSQTGALLTTGAADGRYALQSATGNFVTTSQTGQFVSTGSTGNFVISSQTGAFLTTGAADNRYYGLSNGQSVSGYAVTGFNDSITGITVTGVDTKTITLFQRGNTTLTANFTDNAGGPTDTGYLTGYVLKTETGQFVSANSTGAFLTTGAADGRYALQTATGNFITTDQTGQFYPTSNPSGFLTSGSSIDLIHLYAKNDQGSTIYKGQPVYIGGANGANPLIKLASNTSELTSSKTIGLLAQDLSVNQTGYIITEGILEGFNTSSGNAGDPMWLGTDGNIIYGLANKPYGNNHLVYLGVVLRSNNSNGKVYVKPQNGFEIEELHRVYAKNANTNDTLMYDSGSGSWFARQISTGDVSGISSYALVSNTGSFLTTGAADNRYALQSATGSFVTTAQTGQFVSTGSTGVFVTTSQTGVFLTNSTQYIREIYIDAAAMLTGISGATPSGSSILNSGIAYDCYAFDAAVTEFTQFKFAINDYDLGSMKAKFYWTAPGFATGNVVWGLQSQAVGDAELLNSSFVGGIEVTDTFSTGTGLFISTAATFTPSGNLVTGDMLLFRAYRNAVSASDTLAVDACLLGISIQYTGNAISAW